VFKKESKVRKELTQISDLLKPCLYKRRWELINKLIQYGNKEIKIIIYGRNCNDEKVYVKYNQLCSLGFYNVYIYMGGLCQVHVQIRAHRNSNQILVDWN
jgi:hypothetical protein